MNELIKLGIANTLKTIQILQLSTLISAEKMAPASNCKCAFSLITSCLFSSQVPLPSDLEVWGAGLKFVEVHQAFFKHDWPHQIWLGDLNRFTTKPLSCLFVNVVNEDCYLTRHLWHEWQRRSWRDCHKSRQRGQDIGRRIWSRGILLSQHTALWTFHKNILNCWS